MECKGLNICSATTDFTSKHGDDAMLRFEEERRDQQFLAKNPETDTITDSTSKQADDGMWRLEEEPSWLELLPGIPDHVTEDLIISKLPWRTLRDLASVSRPWNQAFQSHLDARLRSLATEKEVIISPTLHGSNIPRYCLHFLADGFRYYLPKIPDVSAGSSGSGFFKGCEFIFLDGRISCLGAGYAGSGFPRGCKFIFLDGKVYCLGGEQYNGRVFLPCDKVYRIDLAAGTREWQQRRSMQYARRWNLLIQEYGVFGVGGKIYVCGDDDRHGTQLESIEVYDPKSNTWDEMKMEPGLSPWESVLGLREAELQACYTDTANGVQTGSVTKPFSLFSLSVTLPSLVEK